MSAGRSLGKFRLRYENMKVTWEAGVSVAKDREPARTERGGPSPRTPSQGSQGEALTGFSGCSEIISAVMSR